MLLEKERRGKERREAEKCGERGGEREERSRDIWKEGCVCVLGPCATLGVSGSCG